MILTLPRAVPRQGLLFEAFIEVCGSRVKHAKFKQACLTAGAGQPIALHSELKLLKHFRLRFYGWLLSALANLGNAGKVQMWYVTSIVKFLGLSRLGQSIMQQIGYAATDRYSDGRQRIALGVYDQLLRYVILIDSVGIFRASIFTSPFKVLCTALVPKLRQQNRFAEQQGCFV